MPSVDLRHKAHDRRTCWQRIAPKKERHISGEYENDPLITKIKWKMSGNQHKLFQLVKQAVARRETNVGAVGPVCPVCRDSIEIISTEKHCVAGYGCLHYMCRKCKNQLWNNDQSCPICRAPLERAIKVTL